MASKIVRYGNIKPPPGAQIDWGHPLAQGLTRAILFNSVFPIDIVCGMWPTTTAGSYRLGLVGVRFDSGANYIRYDHGPIFNPYSEGAALFTRFSLLDTSVTNRYLVSCGAGSPPTYQEQAIIYGYVNNTFEHWQNPRFTISSVASGDTRFHQIGWYRLPGNTVVGFWDGAQTNSSNGTAVTMPSLWINSTPINTDGPGAEFDYLYCYRAGNIGSRTLASWLHAEPYDMFYTRPQTSYSFSFRTPQSFDSNNPTQKVAQFTPFDSLFKNELSPQLSYRNTYDTLVFPDSNPRFAVFQGFYPDIRFPRGIRVELLWMTPSTTTTQSCVWGARIEPVSTNTDLDVTSFNEISYGYGSPNSVSGKLTSTIIDIVDKPEIQFLQPKTPFRLVILREANSTYDTLTANAELVAVKVYRI